MESDLKDKIFDRYFVDCEKADNVCRELQIDRAKLTKLSAQIDIERSAEVKEMRRIRQLYNNKRGTDFKFSRFNEFYYWYINQYSEQKGRCYYCKTEEKVIARLFSEKYSSTKRPNRGQHLEVERRNSTVNDYSKSNCVLACYFCNNDKSDIFSEQEYFEYLKDRKSFFEQQYDSLK
ncbi:hypothetical protein ES708_22644 [subsurface metagenome]